MINTRKRWLRSFGKDKKVFLLREQGDIHQYLTRDQEGDPYGRMPCFHVWHGNQWLFCGPNQAKADQVYEREIRISEGGQS